MKKKKGPATPLPWNWADRRVCDGVKGKLRKIVADCNFHQNDAAYIAHAANLYCVLVEALKEIRTTTTDRACVPIIEEALSKAGEQ